MAEQPDKRKKNSLVSVIYHSYINTEPALRRYLRRFFYRDEDIDDMAQETFLRAYKFAQNRPIEYPKAYLFKVAKSVALRELSKKNRQLTDYIEEACDGEPDGVDSLEEEVIANQSLALFCEAIADLPPQCRRVFLMRKYHAMSHKDIASELNISVSAVEQHITIGIKRCKSRLDNTERGIELAGMRTRAHVREPQK